MGNKIYIPAIKPEDWKRFLADPDKQWQPGYSAKAIAYAWQEADGFPTEIQKVFNQSDYPVLKNIELLLAIPEHKVPLPGGVNPSQNDVFAIGRGNEELITIAVEGKVSERFGPLVSEWFLDPSEGKKVRLKYLCETLNLEENRVSNIRYQLLHRTASSIIEAKRFNASNALMLVHSFSPENEWLDDFGAFTEIYGAEAGIDRIIFAREINNIKLYLGWIKGRSVETFSQPEDGVVITRKCECCGHHEIGVVDTKGEYNSLKPGTKIKIIKA